MIDLPALPATFDDTRNALQRVAVHVVARAVIQAGGRIDIRVAPGGFATPEFGDGVRVRVTGGSLVREVADQAYESSFSATPLAGSSLADLADVAGVDLGVDVHVGHDTPPLGDVAAPLAIDPAGTRALAAWFAASASALDVVAAALPSAATPTAVRLWPEHFDVAIDVEAAPGQRVNLGGSPGDGFHAAPYAYVGPWTEQRPGDAAFWNAPFGAVLSYDAVAATADPVAALADFFADGIRRFG